MKTFFKIIIYLFAAIGFILSIMIAVGANKAKKTDIQKLREWLINSTFSKREQDLYAKIPDSEIAEIYSLKQQLSTGADFTEEQKVKIQDYKDRYAILLS